MEAIKLDNILSILGNFKIIVIIIIAFLEAIFLPVPMELVSIPIYLSNPTKAFFYSTVLIIFSILGSITGYHLSSILGKSIINKFVPIENFNKLKKLYDRNSFLQFSLLHLPQFLMKPMYCPLESLVYILENLFMHPL